MKYIYFSIASALFLLNSCKPDVNPIAMIGSKLKKFDTDMVSHFPRSYLYDLNSFEFSFPDSNLIPHMGVWFRVIYSISDRIDIDSLINMYSSSSIKECFHNDSCNLLIPRRNYHNHTIGKLEIIACPDTGSIIPVPSFYKELYDLNLPDLKYLPTNYTLFVLDAKPGKYIHGNLLMKEGVMPGKWEHGYSKGVAIDKDKREAIYWIEIW